jgi:CDP-glycerol glycerophosphotransferase (TagB/SpsB family)
MSNPYLDQVREELRAAKRDVERARVAYNEKLKVFQQQKARYERLELVEFDERLNLEMARQRALADGDAVLAALLCR